MKLEPGECAVMCTECNGYLHSISTVDSGGKEYQLVSCPYVKDPTGKCTGMTREQAKGRK